MDANHKVTYVAFIHPLAFVRNVSPATETAATSNLVGCVNFMHNNSKIHELFEPAESLFPGTNQ